MCEHNCLSFLKHLLDVAVINLLEGHFSYLLRVTIYMSVQVLHMKVAFPPFCSHGEMN